MGSLLPKSCCELHLKICVQKLFYFITLHLIIIKKCQGSVWGIKLQATRGQTLFWSSDDLRFEACGYRWSYQSECHKLHKNLPLLKGNMLHKYNRAISVNNVFWAVNCLPLLFGLIENNCFKINKIKPMLAFDITITTYLKSKKKATSVSD